MAKHRTHSIEFKRQVVQEFLGGESPHALAKRHGISRNLIKIWVAKYEAGGLDSDAAAADNSILRAVRARARHGVLDFEQKCLRTWSLFQSPRAEFALQRQSCAR